MLQWSGRKGIKWRVLPVIKVMFHAVGLKWAHFYAWMLNRQDRNVRIDDLLRKSRATGDAAPSVKGLYDISVGEKYVDFLKVEGVKPDQKVLDFGCGYGRIAVPLIRYLDKGNYVGVDLSAERIRLAREYISVESLDEKEPTLSVAPPSNKMDYLPAADFDVVWAHSVFAHMPVSDFRMCLTQLRTLLRPEGVLMGNYGFSERRMKTNLSAFFFTEAEVREIVDEAGFVYGETSDYWVANIAPERETTEKMLRLTLKP